MWNGKGFSSFMSVAVWFNTLNLNELFLKDAVEVEYNTGDKENQMHNISHDIIEFDAKEDQHNEHLGKVIKWMLYYSANATWVNC